MNEFIKKVQATSRRAFWIDHEASDAETSPFEHEATSTDLGVPWLDDAAGPAIGTLDVTDLIDATIDLPED